MPGLEPKKQGRILIAEDEPGMQEWLKMELSRAGHSVEAVSNGIEAAERIERGKFDLVISDLKMPQMGGAALLDHVKRVAPQLEVILMTGYGTVESAVLAMKKGAYDFILKPFSIEEMILLVEKSLEKRDLKTLVALYESSRAIFSTIQMDRLFEIIMDMLQTVLGGDEGSLMLFNEEKKLVIAASRGLSEEIVRQTHVQVGERIAGRVAEKKQAVLLVDGLEKYPDFRDLPSNDRIKSSIICPLIWQGELSGILNINRTRKRENFTVADLQSASIFAAQVSLAIQNAKLYEGLRQAYQKLEAAQNQLVQSEKLASIGRLVAGVAHELNNPLTSVIGYSQLALESEDDLTEIRRRLSIIFEQAQRCNKIVKELLLFAQRRTPEFQQVDLCRLIDESLEGISIELNKQAVKVSKHYPSAGVHLQADPQLIQQVFTNILANACQALEAAGHEKEIGITISSSKEKVLTSFSDNGPGISQEVLHKIFDPFFTTKGVGKGTGLGLSLSYGIIKEHGGTITVKSECGRGTAFTVELPLEKIRTVIR